ncbi:MAG TPA: methylated-DNA--[protein]-cysteine S-methyltransferase [Candidatus Eremiobacteraceae bacterium]|nr:methylated-DNA--[protein]-cysteine S-methyltransferase [Candidatus Eremiobacteraceae bacterium]
MAKAKSGRAGPAKAKRGPIDLATAVRESRAASINRSAKPDVLASLGMAIAYVRVPTKIGDAFVAYGRDGVDAVRLVESDAEFVKWHAKRFKTAPIRDPKPPADVVDKLKRGLAGDKSARVAIDLGSLTDFQRLVLDKTREIARGEVRTYAWLATEVKRPRSALAVRTTLANNPVPLLVPCHRVVAGDDAIGEYVFGLSVKKKLLALEGIKID